MSLITIFGINASGKDAIAKRLKLNNPKVTITSESRLLMYLLGITKQYGADYPVSKEEYKALENTPQTEILSITNNEYRGILEKFRDSNDITILLSHLVFMLHIDKEEPVFLTEKNPPFPELSNLLIQIKSDPDDILKRRITDHESGVRERYHSAMETITKHQLLCDQKWELITSNRNTATYLVVTNNDLEKAASDVSNYINNSNL